MFKRLTDEQILALKDVNKDNWFKEFHDWNRLIAQKQLDQDLKDVKELMEKIEQLIKDEVVDNRIYILQQLEQLKRSVEQEVE